MKALRRRYGHAASRAPLKAEARRRGEIAGSQHADDWVSRNPGIGRDELETAYVRSDSIRDNARSEAQKLFGYTGKRVETALEAFTEGYVAAWKKELMREIGRLP